MVYTNFCQPLTRRNSSKVWYNESMLVQLLILFFIGLALCFIAFFLRNQKALKTALYAFGGILMLTPLALLIYFLFLIFSF